MINLIKDCLAKNKDRLSLTDAQIRSLGFVLTVGYRKWIAFVFLENCQLPSFVVKISDDHTVFDFVLNSYRVLSNIHESNSAFIKDSIPLPVCLINDDSRLIVVNTYLDGTPMALGGAAEAQNKNMELAISWLTEFHNSTRSRELDIGTNEGKRFLLDKIDSLILDLELTDSRSGFIESIKEKIRSLTSGKLPLVIRHNDFEHTNILLKDDSIRVIDWEYSKLDELPFCDLFTIILKYWFLAGKSAAKTPHGALKPGAMNYLDSFFTPTCLSTNICALTDKYCEKLNICKEIVELIFAIYILERKDEALLDLCIKHQDSLIFKTR